MLLTSYALVAPRRSCAPRRGARCSAPCARAGTSSERAVQFMVDMACQSCVTKVHRSLDSLEGVRSVVVDLGTQTVMVEGSAGVEELLGALTAGGRSARLIGQGSVAGFGQELAETLGMDVRTLWQSLAAVSEFKGEAWGHRAVVGVVRFVQVDRDSCRVEAALEGLVPGERHSLAMHAYGDLTAGAASTGPLLSVAGDARAGLMGTLLADQSGCAELVTTLDARIPVWDIIGRALLVYQGEQGPEGAVASVIARSAVAGDNTKKICACDGTLIWTAGDLIQPPKV